MNLKTMFASRYLKADELEGDVTYTIAKIEVEKLGQGKDADEKPVIYFRETEKALAANKTNCKTIANLYGNETDEWVGKRITLFATEVDFQGDQVLAIRVRMKAPAPAAKTTAKGGTAPTSNGGTSPRAKAWKAFCDATPNTEMDDRREAWAAAVAEVFPDRDEKSLGGADWVAFAQKIESEYTEGDGFLPI